jgi:hypothetical protein
MMLEIFFFNELNLILQVTCITFNDVTHSIVVS